MAEKTLVSVVIPAYNEEKYIGKCIRAIRNAERYAGIKAQIIVVANRCTDNTAGVARKLGAEVCIDTESRCIAAVRNTGIRCAKGRIVVTIDADSCMEKTSIREIMAMLRSGQYIGGGTNSMFDRMSAGILFSGLYVALNLVPIMVKNRCYLSGGMFWFYKRDFDAIGGFDESLLSLEDMDFARRLKDHGEKQGKKYGTLKRSKIITSSRKFDEFGDWYLIKNRKLTKAIFTGKDRKAADKFYYDVRKK